MPSRITLPSFSTQTMLSKNSDEVLKSIEQHVGQYEDGFLSSIIQYIKKDNVLKNYYIRMAYECEVIRKVIEKKQSGEIPDWFFLKLEHELENMQNATNAERMAVYDSEFHTHLFYVAGEEGFFSWYNVNSKVLQDFLDSFWIVNFEKKDKRDMMILIHKSILEAIKENDTEKALQSMQDHFSAVILISLSSLYKN